MAALSGRFRRVRAFARGPLAGNVAARVVAMAAVAVATLLVARSDGAEGVGVLAMLRVLPGLAAVVASAGLPGAVPFFLAAPADGERGGSGAAGPGGDIRATIVAIAVCGGTVALLGWVVASPAITPLFFRGEATAMVALAGVTVLTQLLATTAKAACQGWDDLPGSNAVIVLEEVLFLPAYALLVIGGLGTGTALVLGLVAADVGAALYGWVRLGRRGFFVVFGRPSVAQARAVAGYGARGQLGGLLALVNLRLDFAILGAIAGPATLGIYAVASKFAEVLRLAPLALTYVHYPTLRRQGTLQAANRARAMVHRAGLGTAALVLPLAVAAAFGLPVLYGTEFRSAVVPACILLVGLAGDGYAAVATAYLYGSGRPGLNSIGVAVGVAVTVVGDVVLIPPFGATGAAIASSAAYLTTTVVLVGFFVTATDRVLRGSPDPSESCVPIRRFEVVPSGDRAGGAHETAMVAQPGGAR